MSVIFYYSDFLRISFPYRSDYFQLHRFTGKFYPVFDKTLLIVYQPSILVIFRLDFFD